MYNCIVQRYSAPIPSLYSQAIRIGLICLMHVAFHTSNMAVQEYNTWFLLPRRSESQNRVQSRTKLRASKSRLCCSRKRNRFKISFWHDNSNLYLTSFIIVLWFSVKYLLKIIIIKTRELTDTEVELKNALHCDSVSKFVKYLLYCLNVKILPRCRYLEISALRIGLLR